MSERKQVQIALSGMKVAGAAEAPGEFEGYASVFDVVDLQGDRIVRGAFAADLERFVRDGAILWTHDPSEPIGIPLAAREDAKGLFLRAAFHGTELAQKARRILGERLAAAKTFGLSIGYQTLPDGARRGASGIREITKLRLLEVSLVAVPANPAAVVTSAKHAGAAAAFDASVIDAQLAATAAVLSARKGAPPLGLGIAYVSLEPSEIPPTAAARALEVAAKTAAALRVAMPRVGFYRAARAGEIAAGRVTFWSDAPAPLYGRASKATYSIDVDVELDATALARTVAHELAHLAGADEAQARAFEITAARIGVAA